MEKNAEIKNELEFLVLLDWKGGPNGFIEEEPYKDYFNEAEYALFMSGAHDVITSKGVYKRDVVTRGEVITDNKILSKVMWKTGAVAVVPVLSLRYKLLKE